MKNLSRRYSVGPICSCRPRRSTPWAPAHAVVLGLACGQHDDRHVGRALVAAQPAADLDPARAFDHPVEDHQIGCLFRCQHQRFVAVGGHPHVVALAFEAIFEQLGQGQIVLDKQQFGR
jgi:hypothetical protein